eukprot:TRINITY_DN12073_c0_g2_i1.p1 TRINITY_DN12073_c0_g2~~TRINITY_DN12073_c0_g2_i1.p1  ORF type:complete len:375 (+),score=32.94 TRINITY_DN12073_c0_g2_i1:57-1181(+)
MTTSCICTVLSLCICLAYGAGMRREKSSKLVVYGVMTTHDRPYRDKLQAQLDTWAARLPKDGRWFAVIGKGRLSPKQKAMGKSLVHSLCEDNFKGIACKEGRIVEKGYESGADWLFIVGEDNYVNTNELEKRLMSHSTTAPKQPVVLGIMGCEMDSKLCPDASGMPSICGGGGYALNRPALEAFMSIGSAKLRSEYLKGSGLQGDMNTACVARRRSVDLVEMAGLVGARIMDLRQLNDLILHEPLTYHYMTPQTMRWLHAKLNNPKSHKLAELESKAFEGGCCCWCDRETHEECLASRSHPSLTAQFAKLNVDFWHALRDEYILSHDAIARKHAMFWRSSLNATSDPLPQLRERSRDLDDLPRDHSKNTLAFHH